MSPVFGRQFEGNIISLYTGNV